MTHTLSCKFHDSLKVSIAGIQSLFELRRYFVLPIVGYD